MRYLFGDLEADAAQRELRRGGKRVAMEPQAFDVLLYLLRHRTRVVPKEELMDNVWGGRFVSETAVTSRIKQVRRAVGDDGTSQTHVRTYHGRGYRFVADAVEFQHPAPHPAPSTATHRPDAQRSPLVTSLVDGREVTWQVVGQGPPDVMLLPGAASLESDTDDHAGLVTMLAGMCRVIRFVVDAGDETDLRSDPPTTEVRVLEAAASSRAVVLAEGASGRAAVRLVAQHPDRVGGLVVVGAEEDASAAAGLGQVGVPALVLHRVGDPESPVAVGRRMAAAMPQAEFRALPGAGHTATVAPSQVIEEIRGFIEAAAAEEAAGQTLTALVGLAGADVEAVAEVLVELGGRRRRGPEGDVVISFDGPAGAFRALASRRARGLVDEVGVGVAIDEVSLTSDLVSGHGVDVARLFARLAAPGEVLLPNVVKQLLAGSGLKVTTLEPVELPYVGPHPVHRWIRP